MKRIPFGVGVDFPIDLVTQTIAILGKKGSGKSNGGIVIAEGLFDVGLPFVYVDPVGNSWGLRSSKDGTPGGGLPIPIFGGSYGDIPLEKTGGAVIADLIVDQALSCVLDISEFSEKDDESSDAARRHFLLDFARRLYRRKKTETYPMHLILEEADDYVPQTVRSNEAPLLRAWSDIVRRGRARGIGITMITQRSQEINKAVLEMIDTLVVLRTTGPRARKAIKDWVEHYDQDGKILASLPGLKTGSAWVWSPEWLDITLCTKIHRRRTFDSAATPKPSARKRRPATLKDVNLKAVTKAMGETIERAKANDPKALHAEIARLKVSLSKAEKARPVVIEPKPKRVEVPLIKAADRAAFDRLGVALTKGINSMAGRLQKVIDVYAKITAAQAIQAHPTHPVAPLAPPTPHRETSTPAADSNSHRVLARGPNRLLSVIARRHPATLTKGQLGLLAGFTPATVRTYLGPLKSKGVISVDGREVTLTAMGMLHMADEIRRSPESSDERIKLWRGSLSGGQRTIFDYLIDVHRATPGERVARIVIAEQTHFTLATVRTYLGPLKRNRLVDEAPSGVRIAGTLFE